MKTQSNPTVDFWKEVNSLFEYKPKPKNNDNLNVPPCSRTDIWSNADSKTDNEPGEKE